MKLHHWRLVLAVAAVSSQSFPQKRRCAFQVTPLSYKFTSAGNVSGSVQLCENTLCCVGYHQVIQAQLQVDTLACDIVEKSCPDSTCKAQPQFNDFVIKCVCNTDMCNSNITWTRESEEPQISFSPSDSVGKIVGLTVIIPVGILLLLSLVIVVTKWRLSGKTNFCPLLENPPSSDDYSCSRQRTKNPEIDPSNIELQQIVGRGNFAAVWQGKYLGSTVAVKVFPPGCSRPFTAEKEVYELPLMRQGGMLHFHGTERNPDGSSLIVLEFAEYGSLHSYLCKHTTSWMQSLRLCQSLSQGLSFLHSDLHRQDVRKPPVAHRDLSSSNVLVRADGTCALCDFGCSTILHSSSVQTHTSQIGGHSQLGTLRYMSPEVLEGSINLRNSWSLMQADVYALGLLLWEVWMRCYDLFEGGVAPQHLLPYESELGAELSLERLVMHVFQLEERPAIPEHWELLPQGSALEEILTDLWDSEPDARTTAQCVVDRLASLQACYPTKKNMTI